MAAIAVVNHLAVLAEVRIVIAIIDRRSFSAGFLVAITVQTKKTNEKSSELKFVLKFAVTRPLVWPVVPATLATLEADIKSA